MELIGPTSPFRVQVSIRGQRFEMSMAVAVTTCILFHTFFTKKSNFCETATMCRENRSNTAENTESHRVGDSSSEERFEKADHSHSSVQQNSDTKTLLEFVRDEPDLSQKWWGELDPDWLRREWYMEQVAPQVDFAMQEWSASSSSSLPSSSSSPSSDHWQSGDDESILMTRAFVRGVWHALPTTTTSHNDPIGVVPVEEQEKSPTHLLKIPPSPWLPPASIEYLPEQHIWVFRFGSRIPLPELKQKVEGSLHSNKEEWVTRACHAYPSLFSNDPASLDPTSHLSDSAEKQRLGSSYEEWVRRVNEDPFLQLQPEFCGMTFVYLRRLATSYISSCTTDGSLMSSYHPSTIITPGSPQLPVFPLRWRELSDSQRWAVRGIIQIFGIHSLLPLCVGTTSRVVDPHASKGLEFATTITAQESNQESQRISPSAPLGSTMKDSPCLSPSRKNTLRPHNPIVDADISALPDDIPGILPIACGRCGTIGHLENNCSYSTAV